MPNQAEGLITIEHGGNREKINLKNPPEIFEVDGSVLMHWHETDSREGEKPRQYHYATAIMPGYTGVRNLDSEEAWDLFNYKNTDQGGGGDMRMYIDVNSPTLLLPLQGGMCPYDCEGCPFAMHAEGNQGRKTKNLNAEEIVALIKASLEQARKSGASLETIGIAFVGSGDATPNQHLKDILKKIREELSNLVSRVRVSTVAGNVQGEHLTPMQVVRDVYSDSAYNGKPIVSIQVSAHNTNEAKRAGHVYKQSPKRQAEAEEKRTERLEKHLLPLKKVAEQFEEIVRVQEQKGVKPVRKPTLTFVCTKETEINFKDLKDLGFSPENTVIQLRPILTQEVDNRMDKGKFLDIYDWGRELGYDVVIMPVSPSEVELKAEPMDDEKNALK